MVAPTADPDERGVDDGVLDSRHNDDVHYLEQLGYKQELKRDIGLFSAFGVQFSSIAVASAGYTTIIVALGFFGPASYWSFVVGGSLQVFAVGLAMAELVSAYPLAGGVYQINGRILHQVRWKWFPNHYVAWQTGWWIVIAHTVSVAAVSWSMVPFVANWFGIGTLSNAQTFWWALGITLVASIVNVIGVKAAAAMNNVGVVAELFGGFFIIIALLVVHHHTQPLSVLSDSGGTAPNGAWLKPFLFAMIFPAYLISSFDSTGNAAEETHDAAFKAPLGVFLANTAAWIFGMIFVFMVYISIPNVSKIMQSPEPVKDILDSAVGHEVTSIFQATAIVALIATCTMLQLTSARVLWSQARDGEMIFPGWLRKVSSHKVPVNATIVCFVMSVIFLAVAANSATALAVLAGLTSLAWAGSYGVTVTSGAWAYFTKRLPHRPFNLGPFSAITFSLAVLWSIVICAILVWQNPRQVGGGLLAATVIGTVVYFLIPRSRRSQPPVGAAVE